LTFADLSGTLLLVNGFSTREAAKRLGLGSTTLARYVSEGKVPAPKPILINGVNVRSWNDDDIEKARKVLPKVANGRKTRYQKLKRQTKPKKR